MNIGRGVSLFLLGIILGGALVNLFIGLQIDNLSLANQSLRNELWARESELQELTAIVDECKKQVVTGIQPHIAFPEKTANKYEEQLLKMEIENHVRELLETLKGQEVKEISYLILLEIISEREIEFQNKEYLLKVNMVVITDKIIVFLDAMPVKKIM